MMECDHVTLADTHQYSRQSFENRARLRTPDGWQWITIPLKGGQRGRPIVQIEIDNTVPWRGKHLRALQYNYRTSPYFEAFEDRFEAFFERDWRTLGAVTVASIQLVSDLLELPVPGVLSDSPPSDPNTPELILESDRPIEGAHTLQFRTEPYVQNFAGFEPGMSVLDALFNLGFDTIELIRNCSTISAGS